MILESAAGQAGLGSNGTGNKIVLPNGSQQLTSAGNGEWIFFPRGVESVSIILDSTGDGRIEATNASYSDVENDTVPSNSIVPWPDGDIGVDRKEINLNHCQAFRQVNISGTTTLYAIAKNS